jgi:hypothetical protein
MDEPWVSQTHKMHHTLDWKGATNSSLFYNTLYDQYRGLHQNGKKIISEKKTMLLQFYWFQLKL